MSFNSKISIKGRLTTFSAYGLSLQEMQSTDTDSNLYCQVAKAHNDAEPMFLNKPPSQHACSHWLVSVRHNLTFITIMPSN